jgi:hypothetical protein
MTPPDSADHNVPFVISGERDTLLAFLGYLRASVDRKLVHVSEDDAAVPWWRRARHCSGP